MSSPLSYGPLAGYPTPSQGPTQYHHAVKVIENTDPALLQAEVNLFLIAMIPANPEYTVFTISLQYSTAAAPGMVTNYSVMVHLGVVGPGIISNPIVIP